MTVLKEVKFINPNFIEIPKSSEIIQTHQFTPFWQTPGLYIAQRIAADSNVRFIGEMPERDHLQVIVVVDADPEELLDKIFSSEQEMFKYFKGMRFDCRVRVISSSENIDSIISSNIGCYERVSK